jgi:hypothetical protein
MRSFETVNLNDMKIGDLLPLLSLLKVGDSDSGIASRYIGKEVIVRSYSAGNHFGTLEAYDPKQGIVVLKNARRLWKWNTDKGVSLSEIATYGIVQANSKICTTLPEQIIAEVDEVLPATEVAAQSIKSAPVYVYS